MAHVICPPNSAGRQQCHQDADRKVGDEATHKESSAAGLSSSPSPTWHRVLQRGLSAPKSACFSPNTSRLSRHLSPERLGSSTDSPSYFRSLRPPENLLPTQQPTGDDLNTNPGLSTCPNASDSLFCTQRRHEPGLAACSAPPPPHAPLCPGPW